MGCSLPSLRAGSIGRAVRRRIHGHGGHVDVRSGADALQAVDDDEIARLQTVAHDAQSVDERTDGDGPVLNGVIAGHDVDEALVEDRADGAVLHEETAALPAAPDAKTDE